MSDVIDVLYRLSDMANGAAEQLRFAIGDAQKVLDKLESFCNDADDSCSLLAESDLFPTYSGSIPARSGLVKPTTPGP